MAEQVKSKTQDLLLALASSCSLAAQLCSTEEEVKKLKAFAARDIKSLALKYGHKKGHVRRMNRINEIVSELGDILLESETEND